MKNNFKYERGDVLEAVRTDIEIGVFRSHRYLVDDLFERSYGIRGIEPIDSNPGQWFGEKGRATVEDEGLYIKIGHVDLGEGQITPEGDLLQVWPLLAQYVKGRD